MGRVARAALLHLNPEDCYWSSLMKHAVRALTNRASCLCCAARRLLIRRPMQTRFVRLTVAVLLLIGALMTGSVSHADACGDAPAAEATAAAEPAIQDHSSDHPPSDSDDQHLGGSGLEPELVCHSVSAGCAGCLLPLWANGPNFAKSRPAFPLSDDFVRSAARLTNFRPPIALL